MYTIELKHGNGITQATLYIKYPFEKYRTEEDFKQHADFFILLDEIKGWYKYLKLN